jgi:hypothetical protein
MSDRVIISFGMLIALTGMLGSIVGESAGFAALFAFLLGLMVQ